jgi:hypothetical protein
VNASELSRRMASFHGDDYNRKVILKAPLAETSDFIPNCFEQLGST